MFKTIFMDTTKFGRPQKKLGWHCLPPECPLWLRAWTQ